MFAFYGEQAFVEFEGVTYTSEALIDAEETVTEWQMIKRVVVKGRDVII